MKYSIFLLVLLLITLPVTNAQSPDDEVVDRALAALQSIDTYASYVKTMTQTDTSNVTISYGENQQVTDFNAINDETTTFIRQGNSANVHTLITRTYNMLINSQGNEQRISYTAEAEMRYVDEKLYFQSRYTDLEGNVPILAPGWIEIDDPTIFPNLEHYNLESRLQEIRGEKFELFKQDPEILKPLITEVTNDSGTLDDGTPVEMITLTITAENLAEILRLDPDFDPGAADSLLFQQLTDESQASITISIDDQGQARALTSTLLLIGDNVDMHALSPSDVPEGVTVTFRNEVISQSVYTQINEPLEPVGVPE